MTRKTWIFTVGLGLCLLCGSLPVAQSETLPVLSRIPVPTIPPSWKGTRMFSFGAPASAIQHVGEQDFQQQVLQSEVPVLVDFYADWCGPCRQLAPALEELAREAPNAKVVKVNVDENPRLAAYFRVNSIPNILVFKEGQVVGQHVGLANKAQLQALLAR